MQSLNTKQYVYPTLTGLFGIGCALLIFLIRRRRNKTAHQDELKSMQDVEMPNKVNAENSSTAKAKDADSLKKMASVKYGRVGSTTLHRAMQHNVLLAISGFLLIVSLVLGSLLIVQSQQMANMQFNTATNQDLATTIAANERFFERGMIYPSYSAAAYGDSDPAWQRGIQQMKAQTGAQWIEIPILFSQVKGTDTNIVLSPSSPKVATFVQGIRAAHASGLKVFFVPLVRVTSIPGGWAGDVDLPTPQLQQTWFNNYWNVLKPYAQAAQANGVEQMAVATELQKLQNQVPATFWNQLFSRAARVFTSTRTYDMNWSSLTLPMPSWLKNPLLDMIGVSSYIPLTDVNQPIPTEQISQLWQQKIKDPLDKLSAQFGKKVLITEIGYRNTSDALYQTWLPTSSAPPDPQLQAQAYNVTLLNVFSDPHIGGTFFWGWDNVDLFAIKGQPAAQVLQNWYSRPVQ